ncbi:MAG: 5-formyltetrahydrofolate cyclo-ligase [Deltaproteobacteria bacterium]|nr:5-formyltetrahydrofolate cyclo-ligase [Deltaproteobacteria bacterium]
MVENRNELRRGKLAERDALAASLREVKSRFIQENLLQIDGVKNAKHIMLYVSFRSEVETLPLFAMFRQKNIVTSAPLTVVKEHRLIPCRVTDPELDLRPGYCHIPEPDPDRLTPLDPAAIDVVLVPGAVFDLHGGRLGYGGGYYDRFLAIDAPQALRVGLAFEMQVVDRVPVLAHDEKLHFLVTEKQIKEM